MPDTSTSTVPTHRTRRGIHRLAEHVPGSGGDAVHEWSPAVDVSQTDAELVLAVALPGIGADQVRVTARGRVLTIHGTQTVRDRDDARPKGPRHPRERDEGRFHCRFRLPPRVDPARISAEYAHGILEIRVPRASAPAPAVVSVAVRSAASTKGPARSLAAGAARGRGAGASAGAAPPGR
jgi:HSP20 family protein